MRWGDCIIKEEGTFSPKWKKVLKRLKFNRFQMVKAKWTLVLSQLSKNKKKILKHYHSITFAILLRKTKCNHRERL